MPKSPVFLATASALLIAAAAALAACAPGRHPRPLFMGPPGISSPMLSDAGPGR